MCMDKGYFSAENERLVREDFGLTPHIVPRGQEKQDLKKIPGYRARRWVVERTLSWMNRYRRILVRWEKKEENFVALVQFVCCILAYRAAGVSG